jgi:hypothetical protein
LLGALTLSLTVTRPPPPPLTVYTPGQPLVAGGCPALHVVGGQASLGLGHIFALYRCSSTSYQNR